MDLVSQEHRRRTLSGRRYLVANGNGRDPNHTFAGRDSDETWERDASVFWSRPCGCRSKRKGSRREYRRQINYSTSVAVDVADDLRRQAAIPKTVLERIQRQLSHRRRRATR